MHLAQEIKPLKPLHTQLVLLGMFLVFGLTIALVSFFFSSYLHTKALRNEISADAYLELQHKQQLLRRTADQQISTLLAARNCGFFTAFLEQPQRELLRQQAETCFLAVANAQQEVLKLRYIDASGMERIRISKTGAASPGYAVDTTELQNQSSRYYSQQLAQIPDQQIWYSALDLDMDHGQISHPLTPVLRLATPLYREGQYQGFVILSLLMERTLEELLASRLFDVMLSNGEGHVLVRSSGPNNRIDAVWSGYLGSSLKLQQLWPDIAHKALNARIPLEEHDRFSLSLAEALPNRQQLLLLLEPKPGELLQLQSQEQKYLFLVTLAIILCSLVLGVSFTSMLLHLNRRLLETQNELAQQMDLVDRYVPISRTDLKGQIVSASLAYYRLTGYSAQELIGRSHSILRHPDTPESLYAELWHSLKNAKVWSGEIKNKRRDGLPLWLHMQITPDYDLEQNVTGFTAICQDISAQKLLEQQALTDPLTGLYNRRHFDATFARELARCVREGLSLGLALIDADHFKQYNDQFGHDAGDQVLKAIAQTLSEGLQRATDFAFRIGGEEFAIIFSGLNAKQAEHLIEIIRRDLARQKIPHPSNQPHGVISISVGISIQRPDRATRQFDLFDRADRALYRAKESGRDRICFDLDDERAEGDAAQEPKAPP